MLYVDVTTGTWGDANDIFLLPDTHARDLSNLSDAAISQYAEAFGESLTDYTTKER